MSGTLPAWRLYGYGTIPNSGSDPDSLIPDPDPAFQAEYQSESSVFVTKKWKQIYSWKLFFKHFWSKIEIYLSLGLQKERLISREAFSPQKKHPAFQLWDFFNFSVFVGHFFAEPDRPDWIRIRIRKASTKLKPDNVNGKTALLPYRYIIEEMLPYLTKRLSHGTFCSCSCAATVLCFFFARYRSCPETKKCYLTKRLSHGTFCSCSCAATALCFFFVRYRSCPETKKCYLTKRLSHGTFCSCSCAATVLCFFFARYRSCPEPKKCYLTKRLSHGTFCSCSCAASVLCFFFAR